MQPRSACTAVLIAAAAIGAVGGFAGTASAQWTSAPTGWETTSKQETPATAVFSVLYIPPKSERLKSWANISHVLKMEDVASGLNKRFKMPRPVPIVFLECGTVNAFYTSEKHAILICYELLDYFNGVFKPTVKTDEALGRKIAGAVFFTFFHEFGHALAGELELPITGKEEDAADELAALWLARIPAVGRECALAAAEWFSLEGGKKEKTGKISWADEHSFDLQRMYDIVCILYGDNQAANVELVKALGVTEERAARCVRETPKKAKAWKALLAPHIREK